MIVPAVVHNDLAPSSGYLWNKRTGEGYFLRMNEKHKIEVPKEKK